MSWTLYLNCKVKGDNIHDENKTNDSSDQYCDDKIDEYNINDHNNHVNKNIDYSNDQHHNFEIQQT